MAYTTASGIMRTQPQRNLGGVNIDEGLIGIELEGEWESVSGLLKNLPIHIRKAAMKGEKVFAEKFKAKILDNIRGNGAGLDWFPLGEKYKALKERKGVDPNQMYEFYGLYISSIKIKEDLKLNVISIGIHNDENKKSSFGKYTVGQYAVVLESGSQARNIIARPLWGPTFTQMGGMKELKKEILMSLHKYSA